MRVDVKKSPVQSMSLPIAIIIVGLIAVGGWMYVRTQDIKYLREKDAAAAAELISEKTAKEEQASFQQFELDLCIAKADENYWSYIKLNATNTKETSDGPVYTALQNVWDTADNRKQDEINNCHKLYQP